LERKVSYLWKEPAAKAPYRSAVSLHGHTGHSKESLKFIADHGKRARLTRWALEAEERRARRKGGVAVNFEDGYWVPPLSPRAAYEVEAGQIAEQLQLESLVSLTDHDNIEAATLLRMLQDTERIPISMEWTVPGESGELHLGIHNLPAKNAGTFVAEMNDYTRRPAKGRLRDLLAELHRLREVLVVLNHPMWDLCAVGEMQHRRSVSGFMTVFGQYVHALELGGLRPWDENQRAADFACGWNVPVIAGGDRHGLEPSACLNLTNAANFAEFAQEVRRGRSHVLFMPQYAEPLAMRIIRVVNDAVRHDPNNPYGATWGHRVFHPDRHGVERPLCELWRKSPAYIGVALAVLRLLETRPMMRLAQSLVRPGQQLQLRWTGEAIL